MESVQTSGGEAEWDSCARLFDELYRVSGATEYGIACETLGRILRDIGRRYLPRNATGSQKREFFQSLRIADLALARGCAAGNERAWERFVDRFRGKLQAVANTIAGEETVGREIAESLYTDLFGTRRNREGRRVSKLESYTGRGSLEAWLRAVVAREYAARFRGARRLISFEGAVAAGMQFQAALGTSVASSDVRLDQAVDEALASVSAEGRFILASYYLDDRTLSDIARMLGVHASTVSRKIEKIKVGVRKKTLRALRSRGIDARQAGELLQAGVLEMNVDVRRRLMPGNDGTAVLMNKPYE